jgi:hypothetical protein
MQGIVDQFDENPIKSSSCGLEPSALGESQRMVNARDDKMVLLG